MLIVLKVNGCCEFKFEFGEFDEFAFIQYRLERSRRSMEVNPHAWQMDTALEEKADANVIRGPNSKTMFLLLLPFPLLPLLLPLLSLTKIVSGRNLSFSNVSARSHSRRPTSVSVSGLVDWTLKQLSVSIATIDSASLDRLSDLSCSLMDGRRECGGSVSR